MNNSLLELTIEIAAYEDERAQLTRIMQELDKEIIREASKDAKLYMSEVIDRYKEVINKLRILLEAYFAEERRNNLPADFQYRKYYRLVKSAL